MTAMNETWIAAPGTEGLYEVSDQGRVRSIGRKGTPGKILAQSEGHGGMQVSVSVAGRVRKRKVHRLVLEAFIGPRPPGLEALHGPTGFRDNRLANLRWGTSSQNKFDTVRDGNHPAASRSSCVRGHPFDGVNLAVHGSSRRCRACNAGRAAVRKGKATSVQEYADAWLAAR